MSKLKEIRSVLFICFIILCLGVAIKCNAEFLTQKIFGLPKSDSSATSYLGDMFILLGSNVGLMIANKTWSILNGSWLTIFITCLVLVIAFFFLTYSVLFGDKLWIEILTLVIIGLSGSALATEFECRLNL